jgi:hypothetical protein
MILPFVIFAGLVRLLPPWADMQSRLTRPNGDTSVRPA